MVRELGYCNGIENYSRFFDGRRQGTRPFCLLDYFPEDYLMIIDESHQTLPQVRGMWGGDRARKINHRKAAIVRILPKTLHGVPGYVLLHDFDGNRLPGATTVSTGARRVGRRRQPRKGSFNGRRCEVVFDKNPASACGAGSVGVVSPRMGRVHQCNRNFQMYQTRQVGRPQKQDNKN